MPLNLWDNKMGETCQPQKNNFKHILPSAFDIHSIATKKTASKISEAGELFIINYVPTLWWSIGWWGLANGWKSSGRIWANENQLHQKTTGCKIYCHRVAHMVEQMINECLNIWHKENSIFNFTVHLSYKWDPQLYKMETIKSSGFTCLRIQNHVHHSSTYSTISNEILFLFISSLSEIQVDTFTSIYKKLTGREVTFEFPEPYL